MQAAAAMLQQHALQHAGQKEPQSALQLEVAPTKPRQHQKRPQQQKQQASQAQQQAQQAQQHLQQPQTQESHQEQSDQVEEEMKPEKFMEWQLLEIERDNIEELHEQFRSKQEQWQLQIEQQPHWSPYPA